VSCDVEGIPVGEWRSLEVETDRLEREKEVAFAQLEAAQRTALESASRIRRLEKQERFLKSKGKDMVRRGLKTLDELEEAEEKERQMESERATVEAAAMPSNAPALSSTEADPFAGVEVPLLSPEVWAQWDSLYGNPQPSRDT
jgi:CO dehydrogenase/acetyl-CoA synthase beta subunit